MCGKSVIELVEEEREQRAADEARRLQLRKRLEPWRDRGYIVARLVKAAEGDVSAAEKVFSEFETDVRRLSEVQLRLNALDVMGFPGEVMAIRQALNDPEAAGQAEQLVEQLARNIRARKEEGPKAPAESHDGVAGPGPMPATGEQADPPQQPEPAGGAAEKVTLKSELEFYQGFVRLKVAVKNSMPLTITDAYFRLVYNQDVFRLHQAEPESGRRGDEIHIGNVHPGEKRTVAFYLDPQICTESRIEGILTFEDAHGNLETVKMPRKLASVVCPIFYTDENINTAMLKRMVSGELDKKDLKVFAVPPSISIQKAFELGKAAVQHHDLRQVREFMENEPYIAESWYFGKVKGREDRLVVRVRALSEQQALEFHVASSSTLMLTGMLAELTTDLDKELEGQQVRAGMRQVTDQREVDALAAVKPLLDRTAESEGEDRSTKAD